MTQKHCISAVVLLMSLILMFGLAPPMLHAQSYVVTISPASSEQGAASIHAKLDQQLSTSTLVWIEARQVEELLRLQPKSITVLFPPNFPLPKQMVLTEFNVFTPDAKMVVGTSEGDRDISFRSEWASFQGRIDGDERSLAVLSFSRSGMNGLFELKGERYYLRAAAAPLGSGTWSHILFPSTAIQEMLPFRCGVLDHGDPRHPDLFLQESRSRDTASAWSPPDVKGILSQRDRQLYLLDLSHTAASSDTIEVRIALEGDYPFLQKMGSVQAATNYMVSIATFASAIYLRDLSAKLTIPFTRVWDTQSNPYSGYNNNIFNTLTGFASYWKNGMGAVDRSVTHMFTSDAQWTSGFGVAGYAYLNSLCSNSSGYGVTAVKDTTGNGTLITFAHELGHNFGAHHTHSCLWPNGPIDHCSAVEGSCYNGPIIDQEGTMMSYCSQRKLEFGPMVASLMRRNAEFAPCAPSINPLPIAQADSTFLDALYASTNGTAWTEKTNWPSGQVTRRFGVSVRGGRVIGISLPANNLVGPIPVSLSNLSALRVLNLSGSNYYHIGPPGDRENANRLSGEILPSLSQLSSLEALDLSNNNLSGTIPASLGNLTSLRSLNLSWNNFTGEIPQTFGNLVNLELLDLWRTSISGTIPAVLGNLRQLRTLVISETYRMSGSIPRELGNLSKLIELHLDNNALTGSIPSELGNLSELTALDLNGNQLTGQIPPELGNIKGLYSLALRDNQLTGTIPATLGNASNLHWLDLAANVLTGGIPAEIGSTKLWHLNLSNNQLTGPLPPQLGNLSELLELELQENVLIGPIPDSYQNLGSAAVQDFGGLLVFRLGDNRLTGAIPDWIGNRPTLSQLDLGANKFTGGSLPSWILNLTNLYRLFLHDLQLTGEIPTALGNLTRLGELKISGNKFTGTIPPQLGSLTGLRLLWLSDNQLTGEIPRELGGVPNLFYLGLGNNRLTGNVPTEINNLKYLIQLALQNNELESLPDLKGMTYLTQDPSSFVSVENNKLTFEDILPFAGTQFIKFTYTPQKPLGSPSTLEVTAGSSVTMSVQAGGQNNTYQWLKNKAIVNGATNPTYTLTSVSAADTGEYTVNVKNAAVPPLTLERYPYKIYLYTLGTPHLISLASPVDGALGVPFPATLKWNMDGLATRYHVEVDSTKAFASPLFKNESVTDTSIQLVSLPWATRYYWRARGANNTGSGNWSEIRYFTPLGSTVSVHDVAAESPREFLLEQNYPNPFNPTTAISFQLSANSYVTLSVFDVLGREVAVLVNGEKPGGVYRITWDASSLPSGIYVYRLQARHSSGGQVGQFTHSKKLILLK